jgi:pimeloyl-ACP methyl ester carboxylesterase
MPFSRSNGVDVWYETAGDGPALILSHANPFDHDLFMYQSAHFSTWFRVINIDVRGYGRSSKMTEPFTLTDLCDDVLGVMRDCNVEKAIFMGCSVGGSIGIMLGLEHPEMFDAIILVGGSAGPSGRYQMRIDGYTNDLATYHREHLLHIIRPEFANSRLGAYLINCITERGKRLKGEAICQVFRAGNGVDMTERLPNMKIPVLSINGEFDNSLKASKASAELMPDCLHRTLPGAGHVCCLEDPAGFDDIVISYLKAKRLMPEL